MANIQVRDTRNGEWSWVYNALIRDPHLTAGDKLVYAALSTFGGMNVIMPGVDLVAKQASMSQRSVQYSMKKLEDVGYLFVERGKGRSHTNVYYLLRCPKGCNFCTNSEKVQIPTLKGAKNDIEKVHHLHPIKIDYKDNYKEEKIKKLNELKKQVKELSLKKGLPS